MRTRNAARRRIASDESGIHPDRGLAFDPGNHGPSFVSPAGGDAVADLAKMQHYWDFVAGLKGLIEGFQQGRRGIRIGWIDIGQSGIEGFVPHRLPD
jgi:hypothetical protein